MRIGLLVLSIGNFGNKAFYNLQEVGLARELDRSFDEVLIYRLTDKANAESVERIEGCRHTTMRLLPSFRLGSNGFPDLKKLDGSVDLLVCFSDTQTAFPSVYQWCKRNGIGLIPYIGVCRSHSDNRFKQRVIDFLFRRSLKCYRQLPCLAKTPGVCQSLKDEGVPSVAVAPVGIDTERLHTEFEKTPVSSLKAAYGYTENEKMILFIGRMTAEKNPLEMLQIFSRVYERDCSYRLLMVGSGELSDQVGEYIFQSGLSPLVKRLERVPNKDIWELYRIADCLVNLNRHEIYGMVLLEAMYYGCKVIACHAPGSDFIIDHGKTGYLADSAETVCRLILDSPSVAAASQAAVISDFSWKRTAGMIVELAKGGGIGS